MLVRKLSASSEFIEDGHENDIFPKRIDVAAQDGYEKSFYQHTCGDFGGACGILSAHTGSYKYYASGSQEHG